MLGPAEQLNNTYFFSASVYKMDKMKFSRVMKYSNLVYIVMCTQYYVHTTLATTTIVVIFSFVVIW